MADIRRDATGTPIEAPRPIELSDLRDAYVAGVYDGQVNAAEMPTYLLGGAALQRAGEAYVRLWLLRATGERR